MISFDANILFPALEPTHADHDSARRFLATLPASGVALSELVLIEVYLLIRNPATNAAPLDAPGAGKVIATLRTNPAWTLLDYPGGLMDDVWRLASQERFPRRRVIDVRLGLSLVRHGVTDFATANLRDFEGLGFRRVWNPLVDMVQEGPP